jgi:hypothetical protein
VWNRTRENTVTPPPHERIDANDHGRRQRGAPDNMHEMFQAF